MLCRFLLISLSQVIRYNGVVKAATVPVSYYNPNLGGGSLLNIAAAPLGEPLNVIVSGLSSPAVLTDKGFLNFAQSIGFSFECLGLHIGNPQR